MRHPDPQVRWFARKLARAESAVGRVTVAEGPGTTQQVGHLVVTRIIEFATPDLGDIGELLGVTAGSTTTLTTQFEVYLSKSAVTLTALSRSLSLETPAKSIILVEVEDPARPDLVSGRYFDIVAAPGYRLADFRIDTMFVEGVLGRALGVNRDGYLDLVKRAFADEAGTFAFFGLDDLANAAALRLIAALKPLVADVTKVFSDGTMPRELWDPEVMPGDFSALIADLGKKLDDATAAILDALAEIPHLALADEIRDWPGSGAIAGLLDQLDRIEALWNDALDFLAGVVRFIRQAMPAAQDTIGTTIGFLCGLWDGIIQAAAGIFETVQLGLTLLKASIEAREDPAATGRFILEAFDEVLQILGRIKWHKVWEMIREEIVPEMIELFEASLDSLADTVARSPATVGYYAGFIVYNIAETFFPPLKLTGAARAIRAADLAADVSRKVVP